MPSLADVINDSINICSYAHFYLTVAFTIYTLHQVALAVKTATSVLKKSRMLC